MTRVIPAGMIRMIQSTNAGQAKSYFSEAMSPSAYYVGGNARGQEFQGGFHGKLAKRFNLDGNPITKDVFDALCENVHPVTGDRLSARTKAFRTIGYDINFHCPKSVSVIHALSKDNHILELYRASVSQTMQDIEADSKTRIRKNGVQDDRQTGELVWAEFIHQTARPVGEQAPDPHLHSHCFVFNCTWDETEQQYKAGQFRDIKRDMPYYQALFHKRLSDNLIKAGYQVKRTEKSFEIIGVPQQVIDLFSKRTDEIGKAAKEKGITDATALSELGARTRGKKQKDVSMTELKALWKQQIAALDLPANDSRIIRFATPPTQAHTPDAKVCIDYALAHSFERASVMPQRRLLAAGLHFALGYETINETAIAEQCNVDDRIIHVENYGRMMCTTHEILQEEQRMIDLAVEGESALKPLYQKTPAIRLDGEQKAAIEHVLSSKDQVTVIRGAAGTGKTTLMQEAVHLIQQTGKQVSVVAPTSQASRGVLRSEGFTNATTAAQLLQDKVLQDGLAGQVLWVDEAGLLGNQEMTELLALAKQKQARLILVGDTQQHSCVARGDALRILTEIGGIKQAEISTIYRQKNKDYKSAVEALSKGHVRNAFTQLDNLGWIKTVDPEKPNKQIAKDYVKAVKEGKSVLAVSPTNSHCDEVTKVIRKKLRKAKLLGKEQITVSKLTNTNLTKAEKADWRNYQTGLIVQFNQNAEGFQRGSKWQVKETQVDKLFLENAQGDILPVSTNMAERFDVYRSSEIKLAQGDKVRITRNSTDLLDNRLDNGTALEVVSVQESGEIKLKALSSEAEYMLDHRFGHVAHDYCNTSHAAQGKTVDRVLISQPEATFGAADAKQFYVSVSRGRDIANIYTDNKEALLDRVAEMGDRQSALELLSANSHVSYSAVKKGIVFDVT